MPDIDPALSIASASRVFASVLRLPCKAHDAKPTEPCRVLEGENGIERRCVCGRRIRARLEGQRR